MSGSPAIPIDLKPMSLSELLDRTFTLYRSNFWLFCGIMALPQVVVAAISIAIYSSPANRTIPIVQQNPNDPFAVFAAVGRLYLLAFILFVVTSLVYAVAVSAVTFAVSAINMGQPTSIRKSYSMLRSRIFGLLGLILILIFIGIVFVFAGVLAGSVVGGMLAAALTFIAPILAIIFVFLAVVTGFVLGFWLLMRFAISIPVFMLEGRGVFDSLARSGVLTKGHRWRIFLAALVMTAIVLVIRVLFALPITIVAGIRTTPGLVPLWQYIAQSITGALSGTLVGSLFTISIVLIYYDLRIRKEGFDLEAMMAALGQPNIAPVPPTPPPPSPPPPPPAPDAAPPPAQAI
jgi:hypothetical protein